MGLWGLGVGPQGFSLFPVQQETEEEKADKKLEIPSVLESPNPREEYYEVFRSILLDEAKKLSEDMPEVAEFASYVVTDAFFAHYDLLPRLLDREALKGLDILVAVRDGFAEYMDTDEYRALRTLTKLNKALSTFYALELVQRLVPRLKQLAQANQELREAIKQVCQLRRGGVAIGPAPRVGVGVEASDGVKVQLSKRVRNALKQSIAEALKEASKETKAGGGVVSEVEQEAKEEKTVGRSADASPLRIAKAAKRLINLDNYVVKIIAAGQKLSREVLRKIEKPATTVAEPSGVARTSRLEEALPIEFAQPDEIFLARLAEGQLLRLSYVERFMRDVVLIVDTSGSMDGGGFYGLRRIDWVKAAALAIRRLTRGKSKVIVIPFNGVPLQPFELRGVEALERLLSILPSGGTDFVKPIRLGLRLAPNRANIIFLSDGEAPLLRDIAQEFVSEMRRRGISFSAFIVADTYSGWSESWESLQFMARATNGGFMVAKEIPVREMVKQAIKL